MQEVTIKIHDITEGDLPPKDGKYLVLRETPNGEIEMDNLVWHGDTKGWTVTEESENLFVVTTYWGHLWAEDTLTGKVRL